MANNDQANEVDLKTKFKSPLIYSVIFGMIGFLGSFVWIARAISKSTNSTAAVSYIFLPFQSLVISVPFLIFGYCLYFVIKHFRTPKKHPSLKFIVSLCISLVLFISFSCWIGYGLILSKVVSDIEKMNIGEIRLFLEQSSFKENKYALNTVVARKDLDADLLYKIASIHSPELHRRMGSLFPVMGNNTKGLAVMRLVARHPNADVRVLLVLAESPDDYVLGDVAGNKRTPKEILFRLSKKGGYLIEWGLSCNPNCPPDILHKLSLSDNNYTRSNVARNYNTAPDDLVRLSKGKDGDVKRNAEDGLAHQGFIRKTEDMETLGRLAADGSLAAVDELDKTANTIYNNIDYTKDHDRVQANLTLMRAAFSPIAEKAGNGSLPAMEALKYANGKKRLRSFTTDAFGIAAGMGNKEALSILLHYKENGLLFSSVVFALQNAAEKNIPEAVDFLVQVINDPNDRALWAGASQGLVGAASVGNEKAKAALKKYQETKD